MQDKNFTSLAMQTPPRLSTGANKTFQILSRSAINSLNSTSHHPNSTSVFVTLSSYEIVRISIFLAIFIISVVANSVLLVNFWRRSNNKSSGRILLKWLVWINTWQTVVILPCAILFFIQRSIEPFSGASGWQVVCKSLISFFLEWCTRFSWILVGLIAVERFYACVRSVTYRREFPVTRLGGLIGCIFCVNFIVSISPFLARMDAGLHPQRHFCTIQRAGYKTYAVLNVAFFGLPLGVMVYCWGRIFALAWSKRLKVYLGNIAVEPAEAIEGPIFTGLAESSATTTTTTLATDASDRHIVPSTTHTVKTFLRRSTSKDSIGSSSSSSVTAATSRKPSNTAYFYNRTHKAIITVTLIVGSFILTAGTYTVSVFLEYFDTPTTTLQPWWFYEVADMAIFASSAIYPFVYGFLHRPVRKEIYTTVRSIFGYGPSHSATLPRRWSISSHIMDYLPTTGASRSHSRRTSADDVLGQHHRRRRSSTSEESDTVSDTSFFHTFLRSARASRRRETAPSILQNCVQQPEPAGIVLNLTKTAPGITGPDVQKMEILSSICMSGTAKSVVE